MFEVTVDDSALQQFAGIAEATDKQMEAARTSALRKMRKKVETLVIRAAAQKLRIPQKALKDRFFSNNIEPGDDELNVWIGTWAISPFSIGSVSAYGVPGKSGGVRAGRRNYPGAFLASIYTGETKVWIRLHSKNYSPELYPTQYRPGDRGLGELRGRFPVIRAAVPIDAVMREVLERDGDEIAREFEKIFARELNYQVNVRGNA